MGALAVLLILGAFVAWLAIYLLVLWPMLQQVIMVSMGWHSMRYPAMLHLIPTIGLPVLIVVVLTKLFKLKRLPVVADDGP